MAEILWPTEPRFHESGIYGPCPSNWMGPSAPDGDAQPWARAPVGSHYYQTAGAQKNITWVKRENNGRDDDWGIDFGVIQQRFSYSDFTDGGGDTGTLVLDEGIPVGAFVDRVILENVTGFTGDTSAVMTVGDGTDADRYNATTIDVFTTAAVLDGGAPSGVQAHLVAKSVTVTVTSAANFTAVTAGAATLKLFYRK